MFKPQLSKVRCSKSTLETQKVTETATDGWGILRYDHLEAFFFDPPKLRSADRRAFSSAPWYGVFLKFHQLGTMMEPQTTRTIVSFSALQVKSLNHKNICRLGPAQILQPWLMTVHKSPEH